MRRFKGQKGPQSQGESHVVVVGRNRRRRPGLGLLLVRDQRGRSTDSGVRYDVSCSSVTRQGGGDASAQESSRLDGIECGHRPHLPARTNEVSPLIGTTFLPFGIE